MAREPRRQRGTRPRGRIAPTGPAKAVPPKERILDAFLELAAERDFGAIGLIDIAERDNARQHDSVGVEHVEEYFARKTARAPRRQVERNIGESFGSDARGKSVDKAAVDKGFDHRMQKRRR